MKTSTEILAEAQDMWDKAGLRVEGVDPEVVVVVREAFITGYIAAYHRVVVNFGVL